MNHKWIPLIACILMTVVCTTKVKCQVDADTTYQNDDSTTIENAIANFYQMLSFSSPDKNKYNDLPQLFTAQGVLISAVNDKPFIWTVKDYAQLAENNFKKQNMEVWGEQETCAQTHIFGKIAQRFSTYKILYIADGKETTRSGINAIQLVKEAGNWLIMSVAWDRVSDSLTIPLMYNCQ